MSGDTESPVLSSPSTIPPPLYDQSDMTSQSGAPLLSAPSALHAHDMRSSGRRPQSILISRTPSPSLATPPPLPTLDRPTPSGHSSLQKSRPGSSSSISSNTSASSSSTGENVTSATDSPSSSLRTSLPSSSSQRGKASSSLPASPSITFAPLPAIEPRTRKSTRGPLGVAARGAILRERRQQILLAQGRAAPLDGFDAADDDVPVTQSSAPHSVGCNSARSRARDPLVDESEDAFIVLGKMLNDAGRQLWKRIRTSSFRKGKAKKESFDIATIRTEDELVGQVVVLEPETKPSSELDAVPIDFLEETELNPRDNTMTALNDPMPVAAA